MAPFRDRRLEEIEQLYRRRFPHFVQVAQAILGDRDRAVEAVQDGFADAIRSRTTFRNEGPLEAWLWRAVVNAAKRASRRPLVEVGVEFDDNYEVPASVFALAPLIAALPERQRLAIFLRYYAELDYRSIARVLGVEVGTVSASLAAAHAAIRKAVKEADIHG
jgi:RNA polymerase sigma-70 factor (ECF subfamily)